LDREDRWGDHREFVQAGIAAVRLIESQEDLSIQNSVRDTWDLIDYAYFSKVVQLNLATLCNVIGAPPPPPVPVIVEMADPGSYLLNWPVAPEATGYAISFRPLGSDEYPPFRFVGGDEAGNVVLTGYDPNMTYAVSLAALDGRGRIGYFSPEVFIGPEQAAAAQ
jgi:hypothetical protein